MSAIILDTCGLIWLVNHGGELTKKTLNIIEKSDIVYVSAASAIEIGCKYALGKLELLLPAEEWYAEALSHHDLIEVSINGKIGLLSSQLPMHHRDPADRLIIATAKLKNVAVVTHDSRFENYGIQVLR